MENMSLENIVKIITHEYAFSDVETVKEVSLNGINFLEIEYCYLGNVKKVCVRADSVIKVVYRQIEEV